MYICTRLDKTNLVPLKHFKERTSAVLELFMYTGSKPVLRSRQATGLHMHHHSGGGGGGDEIWSLSKAKLTENHWNKTNNLPSISRFSFDETVIRKNDIYPHIDNIRYMVYVYSC